MIRAGRNLPDKEFRYLRTVIVTADIHGGLGQLRKQPGFTFPHWSQVTPYTSTCVLAESCVFAKQSVAPLYCGSFEHPFYLRYGANLPSSLERFNPRALEYSSRIPVSVCGTGNHNSHHQAFLGSSFVGSGQSKPYPTMDLRPLAIVYGRSRNINRVCIDYALQPRLSSRLTLSGRTLLRKPYPYGE